MRFAELFNYYKGLISLRKGHPAFRLPTTESIQDHIKFIDEIQDSLFVAYRISNVKADRWKDILVLLNGNKTGKPMHLPAGNWMLVADGKVVDEKGILQITNVMNVPPTTGYVLFKL